MTEFFTTHTGQQLAYSFTNGVGPTVIFLGGFKSDMEGSKAIFLENWAQKRKRSFLRFDYSGHGKSEGVFTDGSILTWSEDALSVLDNLTNKKQIREITKVKMAKEKVAEITESTQADIKKAGLMSRPEPEGEE